MRRPALPEIQPAADLPAIARRTSSGNRGHREIQPAADLPARRSCRALDQRRRVRSARLAASARTREPARSRCAGTPMAARSASPSVDRGRRAAAPHGQATRSALKPSRSTTSPRPAPCRRSHRTAAANLHGAPATCPPNVRVTGPTSTAPPVVVRPGARPTTARPARSVAGKHRARGTPMAPPPVSHPHVAPVFETCRVMHVARTSILHARRIRCDRSTAGTGAPGSVRVGRVGAPGTGVAGFSAGSRRRATHS